MDRKLLYTVCLSLLACVLFCYPLWLNARVYPTVPVFESLVFHGYFQWLILFLWLVGFIAILLPKFDSRYALACFIFIGVLLALQDKLRWQPWYYQYGVMLIFYLSYTLKLINERTLVNIFRIMTAAIYIWSGIHKINAGFVENILPGLLGFDLQHWGYAVAASEAFLGAGLLIKKSRNLAVIGLCIMHVFISFKVVGGTILYDLVILPWNISMIILLCLLFWEKDFNVFNFSEGKLAKAVAVILFAALPALNFCGVWHDFQSFTLFSGKEKKGYFYMSEPFKNRFSTEAVEAFNNENRVFIQKLSYPEVYVPTNSELSVYFGLFKAFCAQAENEFDVVLEVQILEQLFVNERTSQTYFCDEQPWE